MHFRRQGTSNPATNRSAEDLGAQLLAETRDEIGRADSKAFTMLAAVVVVAGLFASAILSGTWSPRKLAIASEVLWWLGTAAFGAGIVLLSLVIYPSIDTKTRRPSISHFAQMRYFARSEELQRAIERGARDQLPRVSGQLLALSKLAARKYKLTSLSICCFGVAVVLAGAGFLLGPVV